MPTNFATEDDFPMDDELFNRIQANSEVAFGKFHEIYYEFLRLFVEKIIGKGNMEAKDIASNAITKALQSRHTFESRIHMTNYMYVVARTGCANYFRRAKKSRSRSKELDFSVENIPSDHFSRKTDSEDLDDLWLKLNHLPEREEAVLRLYFKEGMTIPEIAAELKISRGAIYSAKHRGIKSLRSLLGLCGPTICLLLRLFWQNRRF